MKVDKPTVRALRRVLNGDGSLSPYMTGPALLDFFRPFGLGGDYPWSGGTPSRWAITEERLEKLNGSDGLAACIEAVVDRRRFLGTEHDVEGAVAFLNQFLVHDGYRIVPQGRRFVVRPHREVEVALRLPEDAAPDQVADFIRQQIEKCDAKLVGGDFDGAITNARSLVEAVLRNLEDQTAGAPQDYDGNLPRLFKRVQKAMRLDPADYDELPAVQQLLRGLVTIVDALAGISNELADRHAGRHRPQPHHARLAVNAANTFCSFMLDSYRRQKDRNQR
ncbi:MAG: abortive infection family protein [Geminicoccaceae bacterium]|nr:abortive infection family protein [Geminicoccaceae bacterium]